MIPAVLSCVFVIYLYHTLNHSDDSVDESDPQSATPESLSARLIRIQERLDELSSGGKS